MTFIFDKIPSKKIIFDKNIIDVFMEMCINYYKLIFEGKLL